MHDHQSLHKTGPIFLCRFGAVFIVGLIFNERMNLTESIPESLSPLSQPIMIAGVVLIFITNFFRKKQGKDVTSCLEVLIPWHLPVSRFLLTGCLPRRS